MEKLITVKTLAQLQELTEYIKDKEYIAYDTETTGVERESQIIGFSICADIEEAYYVVISYWDVEKQQLIDLETKEGVSVFLNELKQKKLIMQNAPFDCAMTFNNFQIELMPHVVHDTLVGGHLLNENRSNGLKERAVELYGEDQRKEQLAMKESVIKNGGVLSKDCYELYKADVDLLAYYGAKDAIMTLRLFYNDAPKLFEDGLDEFFYIDETMPLLRGPTYDMNTAGLRVDPEKLQQLKSTLEAECLDAEAFIHREIADDVKSKYPGTSKKTTFNIGSHEQLAWLLFVQLGRPFNVLSKTGKEVAKAIGVNRIYTVADKRNFIDICGHSVGFIYIGADGKQKKVGNPWKYLSTNRAALSLYAKRYKWVEKLLEYNKNKKILSTYVKGIQAKMKYNVIRPNFLQHGTTSGRYSCKNPNFQNLPRDDKRIKSCIIARDGNIFVGADYSQLEPRVFASISQDETLMNCFAKGEDFYSVVGAPIFDKNECSLYKNDKNSFSKLFPGLRDKAKVIALATPYGRTAFQQASVMGITKEESQSLIDRYFDQYPKVEIMMLDSHEQAKRKGVVHNLFGRPRRMPEAMNIPEGIDHKDLPYEARNLLNLAMNHRVQSTAASIMNRAAIAAWNKIQYNASKSPEWKNVKIVLQVHDELILEGPEALGDHMVALLKDAMENTAKLPGVQLIAEPKKAYNLADLK